VSSGRQGVFIREFRSNGTVGREIPVPIRGARGGAWFKQEQPPKLLFIKDLKVYSVELRTEPTLSFSEPVHLAWASEILPQTLAGDLLSDGRAMVVVKGEDEEKDPDTIRVVLNWFDELEPKMAAGG